MNKSPPSPEQLDALHAYAKHHGRTWRQSLADAWWTGTDADEPNGHLLRQLRNQQGPLWLATYNLPKEQS